MKHTLRYGEAATAGGGEYNIFHIPQIGHNDGSDIADLGRFGCNVPPTGLPVLRSKMSTGARTWSSPIRAVEVILR